MQTCATPAPFPASDPFPAPGPFPAPVPAASAALAAPPPAAEELLALIPDLTRLARRLTRDAAAAEDLRQEVLMRVWMRLREGAAIGELRPYLMTAARNLARRRRRPVVPLDDVPEPCAPPEAPRRLAAREVLGRLGRLPAAEARLILRHAAAGESYAEIAAAEGLCPGTVMSRLSRARARLRAECGLPGAGAASAALEGADAA